ncbi:MAG TPA: sulfatase/phosphatase domain-containing protein [Gemmatimonadaceae bacterium]|nr:sulfatase/phosphatase domain-containing protein [Gemmatimonadaceae bacterium]
MRLSASIVLAAALPLVAMSSYRRTEADTRPNVVFLFSDDHAAHAISAYHQSLRYGIKLPPTPNLDRLANDGMLFVNSFVTNSICGPARATVLTGQYGHLNGVMTNSEPLHPTTVTFPKLMQEAGYQTALFGKWHLRTNPEGFDRYEILAGQGPYYNPVLHSGDDSVRYTGYTLDVVTDRAMNWLNQDRDKSKPFLMMLNFNAPHRWWDPGPDQLSMYRDTTFEIPKTFWDDASGRASPAKDPEMKIAFDLVPRDLKLEPPNNLNSAQLAVWNGAYSQENDKLRTARPSGDALAKWKYQRFIADYMRVISALDDQVGRILAQLDKAGLSKNTIVVYSSDQGFFLGDHGWFDKRWMYEESLRTPLLVKWPGVVKPGSRNNDLVMNLDLAETFLDVAGVQKPSTMQGESIVPLLKGSTPKNWRDAIYYQYFEYPGWHAVRRQYGVRTQRYKLIHYYEVGEWELFDLDKDPEELRNVVRDKSYTTVRKNLALKLAALRKQYAVPDKDPAPYYPWELPPEYRRAGKAGSSRSENELFQGPVANLTKGVAAADSLVQNAIGTLTPGAVLLIAKDGKVIHERAFGYAALNDYQMHRLASPVAMKTSTMFDLASVTKVMATTFATMMLVERGKINLDAPVYRYLPDFRGPHLDSITVRHLLQHSSGLVQWQPLYYQAANSAEAYQAIRKMPLAWGVGEGRHYSDLGFMLLGYIVEKTSGMRLDQFVESQLYKPLGLTHTTFNPVKKGFTDFAVTEQGNVYEKHMVYDANFGYDYRGDPRAWNGWRTKNLDGETDDGNSYYANGGVAGHAGLFSTADDLAVLLDVLLNRGSHNGKQYISPGVIDSFFTLDKYGNYLGWQMPPGMPDGSFMHTGFTGTYVLGIPRHKLSVVLLTNRQNLGTDAKGFFPDVGPLRLAAGQAILAAVDPQSASAHFEPADFQSGKWLKGNTHTHTLESDGDSPPDTVAAWYKTHGYNFLVLSDHNVWVDPARFAYLFDSTFMLIPGEELTTRFEKKPVHVNGLNIPRVIPQITDSTLLGTIQKNVDAVRAMDGVPHINHPNFGWAISEDVLWKVNNDKLIEIHNGHPLVHNEGGGDSPGMEMVWDYLLTKGKRIYGIAVDDAHHFKGEFAANRANPGRGWVVVRAGKLDALEIMTSMEAGRFYASSGVELDSIRVAPQDITIGIRQRGDFKFTTEFIGKDGTVLKKTGANPATYHLSGSEAYVRATVTNSGGEKAWIQPVFVVH